MGGSGFRTRSQTHQPPGPNSKFVEHLTAGAFSSHSCLFVNPPICSVPREVVGEDINLPPPHKLLKSIKLQSVVEHNLTLGFIHSLSDDTISLLSLCFIQRRFTLSYSAIDLRVHDPMEICAASILLSWN